MVWYELHLMLGLGFHAARIDDVWHSIQLSAASPWAVFLLFFRNGCIESSTVHFWRLQLDLEMCGLHAAKENSTLEAGLSLETPSGGMCGDDPVTCRPCCRPVS